MTSVAEPQRPLTPQPGGYLFLPAQAVPEQWQARAVPFALVPLLPNEATAVLQGGSTARELPGEDDLLRLVAQGLTREVIARRLGISVRTVQRRLAQLQTRTGTGSLPELAACLARQGF